MKIVVTRDLPGTALEELQDHRVEVLSFGDAPVTEEDLIAAASDADALISLLSDPISRQVIEGCPRLRVIAQYAVGHDNIDLEAARENDVVVTNTPDVLTDATADFAFALLLAAARKILPADRSVRDGRFTRWETDRFLGMDLHGKTLGVVGLGRIGAATARRAIGFGMHIVYHNRSRVNPTLERFLSARHVSLTTLLKESDVVTLHCNLNPDSHHLIDASAFERMKPSAILVNTARGAVVDEEALVKALADGQIAAAGLDVFEDEPSVHADLLNLDNVVLAPHLGSATLDTRSRMAEMCVEAVRTVFEGAEKVPYRVA